MDRLNLDYETRSEVNLTTQGLDRYVNDKSTKVLMAAWRLNGGEIKQWDISQSERPPRELLEALRSPDVIKDAFHAQFERLITNQVLGIRAPHESWRCTMVLAYMMGFVGTLDMIGKAMNLPSDVQKMKEGKRLIKLFSCPQRITRNQPLYWRDHNTDPDDWDLYLLYNRQDVAAESNILRRLNRPDKYPVPDREWRLYGIDQRINDRGVRIDLRLAQGAIELADQRKPEIMRDMRKLTGLSNPGSPAQLQPWLADMGYPFADLKKDSVSKAIREADDKCYPKLMIDVLKMRQASSKTSIAKYKTMLSHYGKGDRYRYYLQMVGAQRTGRWAGRKLQPHNMPRTPKALERLNWLMLANKAIRERDMDTLKLLNGEPMDTIVGCLRSAFIPAEGKKFVVCDLSSIESVVIGWLTNAKWFLDTLAAGHDLYRAFAAEWLQIPYDETKPHRSKAKPATLGAGFRLGGGEEMSDGKKTGLWGYGENMGVFLTREQAHSSVQTFRDLCPEIVQSWYALERAAIRCVQTRQDQKVTWEIRNDAGDVVRSFTLPIVFEFRKPFLAIKLPSGRRLYYFDPKIVESQATSRAGKKYTKRQLTYMGKPQNRPGWERLETHGGKLIENIVQAIARDILAIGMMRVNINGPHPEKTGLGYPIYTVLHVHDELVNEIDERADDQEALAWVHKCMTDPISWAPRIPLGAAGFVGTCYRKD